MKRLFDFLVALVALVCLLPVFLPIMFLVWKQDKHSPFYIAKRVGLNGSEFDMFKLRSMVINADSSGVDSTSSDDNRITPVGHFIRRYKLDELSQLWNVLIGDMSLVGPRPNVKRETDLYTSEEKKLLMLRPGITDISSIVFSDEGDILEGQYDPDLTYNQLIRPGKSKLGLYYVQNRSLFMDIKLCLYTALAIIDKESALEKLVALLTKQGADQDLVEITSRKSPLKPSPPPGSDEIVQNR